MLFYFHIDFTADSVPSVVFTNPSLIDVLIIVAAAAHGFVVVIQCSAVGTFPCHIITLFILLPFLSEIRSAYLIIIIKKVILIEKIRTV